METLGKIKQIAKIKNDNKSAITYECSNYKIVEFNTKANTLDSDSMDALKKATDKNLIVINEGMQFFCWSELKLCYGICKKRRTGKQ